MSHSLDYNIREQLADYMAGKLSLREFEDWFFPETWDIDEIENTDDQTSTNLANLVYGIKLRLAEFSHGDWTEVELRSMLLSILEKYVVVIGNTTMIRQPQVVYGTSSSNYSVPMPIIYSGRHVGIVSSTEYV
jgi:hypothetical protein